MVDDFAPATGRCPDHSTCRNCGEPISWDDVCYTHDKSGFADCRVTWTRVGDVVINGVLIPDIMEIELDPQPPGPATYAQPVEWGPPVG